MEKIKILHCGDIHLDTPFKEFNKEVSKNNKEEIKNVFKNIINICEEKSVDILLIAGDVFDNYTVKKETLKFIKEVLEKLKTTRVFISPGNHDPYNEKSFYKLIDWPKNTYIFKSSLERIDIDELKVSVHGFAFNEKYKEETMFRGININENNINIMVCHGDTINRVSEYNPILKEDIESSGLDYIGVGHIHKYSGIIREGRTSYAYSGCPQGRGFDELGEKGVILGEVAKGYTNLEFLKTSVREYYDVKVNIEDIDTLFKVEEKIIEELKNYNISKDLFKVTLIGEVKPELKIDVDVLKKNIEKNYYFLKIIDKAKIKIDIKDYGMDSIKGLFINEINERKEKGEDDEEILKLALNIGLRSLVNDEVNLDDY